MLKKVETNECVNVEATESIEKEEHFVAETNEHARIQESEPLRHEVDDFVLEKEERKTRRSRNG
ncbi:hypothetical protein LR68_02016 [Anoxybacillus sp. BCO1]|nr:hypothetical protein LR68_02016 [Anoxybacillus sp. BCO1]